MGCRLLHFGVPCCIVVKAVSIATSKYLDTCIVYIYRPLMAGMRAGCVGLSLPVFCRLENALCGRVACLIADGVALTAEAKRVHGAVVEEPGDEAPRGVGGAAFAQVPPDERQRGVLVDVQRGSGQGRSRGLGLLCK